MTPDEPSVPAEYTCKQCDHKPFKSIATAMNHLKKKHGLTDEEIKAGTPKLWTHYLEWEIHVNLPSDIS